MKEYSQSYFFFFLFNLFFILVDLSYANSIEKDITIEGNNPFVKMKIGNHDKKFLISFSSPLIITFPKEKGSSFVPISSKSIKYIFKSKELNLKMGKDNFTLSDNIKDISFNISSLEGSIPFENEMKDMKDYDGILGLNKSEIDIFQHETFLKQLIAKKYISKKIIYIAPYYNLEGKLNDKSRIKIGEFPKEFKKEIMHEIPLNSKNGGFEFNISDLFIEDNLNKTNVNRTFIARIEEGLLEPISFPNSLFKTFENHFRQRNCTINKNNIHCSNKTDILKKTNIKFKINKSLYQLGSIWKDGNLNIKFIEGESIILTSEFTGNYDRVYDEEENKIFFSDFGGYKPKISAGYLIIVLISIGSFFIIAFIVIIIVVCINLARGKNLKNKVNSISFSNQEDGEEELLY